jgi:Ca2+-binding EF-hand superfamily protein
MDKLRSKLASRGARGIISLGKAFRVTTIFNINKIVDDNHTNTLDMEEFKKACRDYRIGLTDEEVKVAFNNFDKRGDGNIDYEEFLREVRVRFILNEN